MFVRILSILSTLTASVPNEHKHSLRRNMKIATPQPTTPTTPTEASTTPVVSQDLLQSVVSFLGTCSRRKNSPLLRDALRSVVDTLDLLSLEQEMHSSPNVNLELDKTVSLIIKVT